MRLLAEALFLFFAFFDLERSKRKINELGVEEELNPVIRWLISKLNIEWGVSLGILVPTFLIAGVGWFLTPVLYFVLGFRFFYFLLQVRVQ